MYFCILLSRTYLEITIKLNTISKSIVIYSAKGKHKKLIHQKDKKRENVKDWKVFKNRQNKSNRNGN